MLSQTKHNLQKNLFKLILTGVTGCCLFLSVTLGTVIAAEKKAILKTYADIAEAVCEERGENPQKQYSGNLMLRISPDVHAAVAATSKIQGKSINQWAAEVLNEAAHI